MAERFDLMAVIWPLSRALRRIEDDAAQTHGLTMWQYAVLSAVIRRPGINQAEAADLINYSKNRIIGDIDALEEAGLIVRQRGEDRRSNSLAVTRKGERTAARIQRQIHAGEDELLADVSADDQAEFRRILRSWALSR